MKAPRIGRNTCLPLGSGSFTRSKAPSEVSEPASVKEKGKRHSQILGSLKTWVRSQHQHDADKDCDHRGSSVSHASAAPSHKRHGSGSSHASTALDYKHHGSGTSHASTALGCKHNVSLTLADIVAPGYKPECKHHVSPTLLDIVAPDHKRHGSTTPDCKHHVTLLTLTAPDCEKRCSGTSSATTALDEDVYLSDASLETGATSLDLNWSSGAAAPAASEPPVVAVVDGPEVPQVPKVDPRLAEGEDVPPDDAECFDDVLCELPPRTASEVSSYWKRVQFTLTAERKSMGVKEEPLPIFDRPDTVVDFVVQADCAEAKALQARNSELEDRVAQLERKLAAMAVAGEGN